MSRYTRFLAAYLGAESGPPLSSISDVQLDFETPPPYSDVTITDATVAGGVLVFSANGTMTIANHVVTGNEFFFQVVNYAGSALFIDFGSGVQTLEISNSGINVTDWSIGHMDSVSSPGLGWFKVTCDPVALLLSWSSNGSSYSPVTTGGPDYSDGTTLRLYSPVGGVVLDNFNVVVAAPVTPSAPLNLVAVGGSGSVTLTWSAPLEGAPITDYIIEYRIKP